MTREEVIDMARAAGLSVPYFLEAIEGDKTTLLRFASLIAAAKREACAQIVTDAATSAADAGNLREYELLRKLAEAIRARGDTGPGE